MFAKDGDETYFPRLVWRDSLADMSRSPVPGGANPTWTTYQGNINAHSFSATSSTGHLWASFHVDHDYAPGTLAYLHVHSSPATAGQTGNALWEIEYSIARGHNQASFSAPATLTLTCATSASQYRHQITEDTAGISLLEPDALLLIAVRRLGAAGGDTCNGAQFLHFVDLHYQADRYGTTQKAPPWDQ